MLATPMMQRRASTTDRGRVEELLRTAGLFSDKVITREAEWFFEHLGIHPRYFEVMSLEDQARHLTSLIAAKLLRNTSSRPFDIHLEREHEDRAMFVLPSSPSPEHIAARIALEAQIERKYMAGGENADPSLPLFRLQAYRTYGAVSGDCGTHLRFYFLRKVDFVDPQPPEGCVDIERVSDKGCLEYLNNLPSDHTKKLYARVIEKTASQMHPALEILEVPGEEWSLRLVIGFVTRSTHSFFSALGSLWHSSDIRSDHKYVEHFSCGVTVFSVYLQPKNPGAAPNADREHFLSNVEKVRALIAFHFILPRTGLSGLVDNLSLTVPEAAYAYALWRFSFQFLERYSVEYYRIAGLLQRDPATAGLQVQLKSQLRQGLFTDDQIKACMLRHPRAIKMLFEAFCAKLQPQGSLLVASGCVGVATPKRPAKTSADAAGWGLPSCAEPGRYEDLTRAVADFIKASVKDEADRIVLEACLSFNRCAKKTNFFKTRKAALSFRLDPAFLNPKERPVRPFGVFFLVGSDFVGFHVRFCEIARGGIRVIRSASDEIYTKNLSTLFDENYALAITQDAKNKDIPEGGAKGTILLSMAAQSRPFIAFQKYIDALLDVILPDHEVVDLHGRPEILFLGPDEGTADFMAWASTHARSRGASFWKAFTTGKPPSMGGIPHDLYGMTTHGVHTIALAVLRDRGVDERTVTKFQTGGPDGDLGSNEIKVSLDRTTAIVDGSGVLYDPAGIDRAELVRLATARRMVDQFDLAKLTKGNGAFRVLITDPAPLTLPSGEVVDNPTAFRNNFHLHPLAASALFVPCGGRPAAVSAANVGELISADGNPRFKYIIEGANLFFTQEARLALEKVGVVVYKDAAANKGGVTSSSLEVLAALALDDAEFAEHMCVSKTAAAPPAFYAAYVKDVLAVIERNALLEYGCVEREFARTGTPRSVLIDEISGAINNLNVSVQSSELWNSEALKRHIIEVATPPTLLAKVGLDKILERVPLAYLKSIFGATLATRFVYAQGNHNDSNPLDLFNYLIKEAGIKL